MARKRYLLILILALGLISPFSSLAEESALTELEAQKQTIEKVQKLLDQAAKEVDALTKTQTIVNTQEESPIKKQIVETVKKEIKPAEIKPSKVFSAEIGSTLDPVAAKKLQINSLVDTPYKLAAHYVPVVLLRAMTQSEFPLKTNKVVHVERDIFVKHEVVGLEKNSYEETLIEKLVFDITTERKGLLGRKIYADGTLNDMPFHYKNELSCGITKKCDQTVTSTLGGEEFIKLKIKTNGRELTNEVQGSILGRKIDYKTRYRTTEGTLGTFPYKIHVRGVREKDDLEATAAKYGIPGKPWFMVELREGYIGKYPISGRAVQTSKKGDKVDKYDILEFYGPLILKTKVRIKKI